ncbi:MAG: hypothetical protein JFR38_08700 [Muribaculaceae bacterium]|nr:hypothetical protein [Muribaculaceae bacterium]
MAKITAPIALSTVGAALGFSAEETRRMGLGGLCNGEHGRTSMWARYKPVRHPSLLPLTEQQRLSVAYGMAEPEGAVCGHPADTAWQERLWRYAPPRGGFKEPFRLTDWDGYRTGRTAPVATPGTIYLSPLDNNGTLRFPFGTGASGIVASDNLGVDDFPTLADYYPCVALTFDVRGTSYTRIATAASTFGDSIASAVSLKVNALREYLTDRFSYFMCGCSTCQTDLGPAPAARYIVLPSDAPLRDSIILSTSLPLRFTFDRVRAGAVGAGSLFGGRPVSEYNPLGTIIPDTGGDNIGGDNSDSYKYLNVGSRATVSFRIEIYNYGSTAITIPANALYCSVSNNLAGATPPLAPAAAVCVFDGIIMNTASSITIPAGETVACAISWPEYCCIRNAAGGTVMLGPTRRFNAGFRLHLNSNSPTTIASTGLNISNY